MLNQFSRTQLLLGKEAMDRLKGARVAVFGIGGVAMDGNRDAIDAFLSKLVVDKEPLMIETDETTIGAPEVRKNFTLAEYIASNFL